LHCSLPISIHPPSSAGRAPDFAHRQFLSSNVALFCSARLEPEYSPRSNRFCFRHRLLVSELVELLVARQPPDTVYWSITMNSQGNNDVSPEAMQSRIQQARREAETLKDRIKRKKDDLADTTRTCLPTACLNPKHSWQARLPLLSNNPLASLALVCSEICLHHRNQC
jgi:hypothetical protein